MLGTATVTIVTSSAARKTLKQSEIMMRVVWRAVRLSSGDFAPPASGAGAGAESSLRGAACGAADVPASSAA